jgi:hypothetical protein
MIGGRRRGHVVWTTLQHESTANERRAVRIGLVPIDDRPVNTRLPAMIAAVAGSESLQPPSEIVGSEWEPGQPVAIGTWILDTAAQLDALIVSLEMLAYGGLIASRTTTDPPVVALQRLAPLDALPGKALRLYGSSIILRASDSYSSAEEPEYWSSFGRELHAFGAALHRSFRDSGDPEVGRIRREVPAEVRGDFLRRRIRNHILNLEALRLAAAGVFDTLLLTSDDTAVHSAGSLEQQWLEHWAMAIDARHRVLIYPGADEIGSVLTARALGADREPVAFQIRCLEPDGLERVAKFENVPLHRTVERQIVAAGGKTVSDTEPADMVLFIHAPSPVEGDWYGGAPSGPVRDELVGTVADDVAALIEAGTPVALADVRYTNGGDPWLVNALSERADLLDLSAYAGWNTAANSIGTAIAHATALVRGRQDGTFDADAHRRLLAHRLLEDCVYQAVVRQELTPEQLRQEDLDSVIAGRLQSEAHRLLPGAAVRVPPERVHLPWDRPFEVDFELEFRSMPTA